MRNFINYTNKPHISWDKTNKHWFIMDAKGYYGYAEILVVAWNKYMKAKTTVRQVYQRESI